MQISGQPRERGVSEAGVPSPPEAPGWVTLSREESAKALDAFEPEPDQADPSRSALTISSKRPPVSLAALKAAGIQIDGDEAIAIGQALCRAFITAQLLRRIIRTSDTTGLSSPVTTETVFIDATGHVSANVSDSHTVPEAIQSVGKILSDIFPPHLRLFLQTKIVASPPQCDTLDELSKALAAHEQPNGWELIQAVYERAEKREARPTEVPTTEVPTTAHATSSVAKSIAPATTPTMSTPNSKPAAPSRSKYHPVAVSAALIVGAIAMVGITGWFLINRWGAEKSTVAVLQARPVAPATGAIVPEPRRTLFEQTHALADRQNLAEPVRAVTRAERPVVSDPPVPRPTRQPVLAAAPPVVGRAEAAGAVHVVRSDDGIVITNSSPAPASTNASPRLRAVGSPAPRPVAPLPRAYSKDDADVTPAVPVLPRLLASLSPSSPGVRLDALTIEILVNASGRSDGVKAVNAPQNMSEWVLLAGALSVVKTWQFTPAMRDGAPVSYRLIIPVRAVTQSEP